MPTFRATDNFVLHLDLLKLCALAVYHKGVSVVYDQRLKDLARHRRRFDRLMKYGAIPA